MKNLGKTTQSDNDVQTAYSVLYELIDSFGFNNLITYGKAIVVLAKRFYNQEINGGVPSSNCKITTSGYIEDFLSSDYGKPAYNNLVFYIRCADLEPLYAYPVFYPYNATELVQLRLDSNNKLCFLRGTDYYTLSENGIVVKKLDTLFS